MGSRTKPIHREPGRTSHTHPTLTVYLAMEKTFGIQKTPSGGLSQGISSSSTLLKLTVRAPQKEQLSSSNHQFSGAKSAKGMIVIPMSAFRENDQLATPQEAVTKHVIKVQGASLRSSISSVPVGPWSQIACCVCNGKFFA